LLSFSPLAALAPSVPPCAAAASIGEHRIRELNDEINKLIRIKGHWERQIISLGGPNHFLSSSKILDGDGKEVSGGGGYRYFGAAKELPGVKELFEKAAPVASKRTRKEINQGVNADYYGFRDDDDGLLEIAESAAQKSGSC
jgi:pre-mRNA-splicing factor ISY1